jgi:hypothetical protein
MSAAHEAGHGWPAFRRPVPRHAWNTIMRPFFENVVDTLRLSAAARASAVRQARSDVREALTAHRSMRREVGRTIRRTLQRHRVAVLGGLKTTLAPVLPVRPGARAADPIPPAPPVPESPTVAHAGVWELWADATVTPPADAARQALQRDVLRIVDAHPQGIRARDIGNALGVDWRRVLGVTPELLGVGVIEQIDQDFYPAGRVNRTW